MAESKGAFRRRLGRLLRVLTVGETSSAGSTTVAIAIGLTDKFGSDDTLNGSALYDVLGQEWRVVTDWLASNGTATVNRAYSTTQASGRDIEVYEQFSPDDLDDALKMALDEAYAYIVLDIIDESNEIEANTYEYPIPSSMRDFTRTAGAKVSYSTNPDVETWPRTYLSDWTVRTDGETYTLVLPTIAGLIGKTLRLEAKGVPTFPATDTARLSFRSDTLQLLAFKAAEIVWRTGPSLSGRDADFAANQEMKWGSEFDKHRDEWGTMLEPTRFINNIDYPDIRYPMMYNYRPGS